MGGREENSVRKPRPGAAPHLALARPPHLALGRPPHLALGRPPTSPRAENWSAHTNRADCFSALATPHLGIITWRHQEVVEQQCIQTLEALQEHLKGVGGGAAGGGAP